MQFGPTLEIGLSDKAYVSLFPSTDIRYDFRSNDLFVPANAELGVNVGDRITLSVEGGGAIIKGEGAPYDWKVEGRMAFRF